MTVAGCIGSGVLADSDLSKLEHREQSFTIKLNAPVSDVTPLFGPLREAEWAPGWKPTFYYPTDGKQVEGAIFLTKSNDGADRIWILTQYDEKQGRVEYVVVTPGLTANQIKIQVVPDGAGRSRATVTYRHSAIAPEGNVDVQKLDQVWADNQQHHWEHAINTAVRDHTHK